MRMGHDVSVERVTCTNDHVNMSEYSYKLTKTRWASVYMYKELGMMTFVLYIYVIAINYLEGADEGIRAQFARVVHLQNNSNQ